MDNDTLINQARQLYATLNVEQNTRSLEKTTRYDRLNKLVINAYCRYLRRLNHCVLCYQHQPVECDRDPSSTMHKFCPATASHFRYYDPLSKKKLAENRAATACSSCDADSNS